MSIQGRFPGIDWFDLFAVQETLKSQTCDLEVFSAKSLEVGGNWEVCECGHCDCSGIRAGY